MKILRSLAIIFTVHISTIQAACNKGYFGDLCENYAEGCRDNAVSEDGTCLNPGCNPGWDDAGQKHNCAQPICFENFGCSNGGQCIAPNFCVCGEQGSQIVAQTGNFHGGIPGTDCISLRRSGIIGAFSALLMMIIAITTCGQLAPNRANAALIAKGTRKRRFGFWTNLFITSIVLIMSFFILFRLTDMFHRYHMQGKL